MGKEERRLHHRYRLWLPARIEGAEMKTRLAVGHDMSQKGVLLVTSDRLEVGDQVRLFVQMPPGGAEELDFAATVLRVERNDADPNGLWPYRIAVEFNEVESGLEEVLRQHMEHLEGVLETGEQTPD